MKKINLLAVILFFTMTAGAGHSKDANKQLYTSYTISKTCLARKNFSTCIENSTNAKEMLACESNYHKLLKIDNVRYRERVNYQMGDTKALFEYKIFPRNILPDIKLEPFFIHHDVVQIDSSCNEIKINKRASFNVGIIRSEIFKRILKADNPNRFSSVKMCALSVASEMNRVQKCNDLTN